MSGADTLVGNPRCDKCGAHHPIGFDCRAYAMDLRMTTSTTPASAENSEAVAWHWEKTGSDTDGDPVVFVGQFGDYHGRVTLSRTDRSWSATINRDFGKLGLPSELAGQTYVEETVASFLAQRLMKARQTIALYAQPQPSQQAGTEELRAKIDGILKGACEEGDIKSMCRFFQPDDPYGDRERSVNAILAALKTSEARR